MPEYCPKWLTRTYRSTASPVPTYNQPKRPALSLGYLRLPLHHSGSLSNGLVVQGIEPRTTKTLTQTSDVDGK